MSTDLRPPSAPRHSDAGFTLIELMVSISVLMLVCGAVMKGVFDLGRLNDTITNRTDMHSGVRNATELLTQEVGQAGRVSLPGAASITADVAIAGTALSIASAVAGIPPTTGMFVNEQIQVGTNGPDSVAETVTITAVANNQITVTPLQYAHANGSPVRAVGAFAAGVIPDDGSIPNGSTGTRLKILGDINGNGTMVYVEYICDLPAAGAGGTGRLLRNVMAYDAANKVPPTADEVLIDNVVRNPDNSPCFTYQRKVVTGRTYITDVAITLTVQSQDRDPVTGQFQQETKALLNVSPRNVFNVWQLASLNATDRVQPLPAATLNLLADPQ